MNATATTPSALGQNERMQQACAIFKRFEKLIPKMTKKEFRAKVTSVMSEEMGITKYHTVGMYFAMAYRLTGNRGRRHYDNSARLAAAAERAGVLTEVQQLQQAVREHDGNITATARDLGIARTTLRRKLGLV